MRLGYRILAILIVVAVGFRAIRIIERYQLYKPITQQTASPAQYHLAYRDVWFVSADGTLLNGWWIPARSYSAPALLLCHGQGGNISDRLEKAVLWHRMGAGVFLFDYRGYGRSAGRPSKYGLYEDGVAAYDEIRRLAPHSSLFIYGESLGGGVATKMGLHLPAAGIILEDTFTSIPEMAHYRYPVAFVDQLVHDRYNNLAKIQRIHLPILIFHSKTDEVIPFEMGRRLYAAAAGPKRFVELSGSHDEAYAVSGRTYTDALAAFVNLPVNQKQ